MARKAEIFIGFFLSAVVGCSDGSDANGNTGSGGQSTGGASTGGTDGSGGDGSGGDPNGSGGSTDVGTISAAKRRIAAGRRHACVITEERKVACWGFGQSGVPDDEGYESVFAWSSYSCALRTDGASICWNSGGVPTEEPLIDLALSTSTSGCGLTSAGGQITCWPDADIAPPDAPVSSGGGYTRIVRGGGFLCSLSTEGAVSCWRNPSPVYDGIENGVPSGTFVDLYSGVLDICAITSSGEGYCWGAEPESSLHSAANGDTFRQLVPGGPSDQPAICAILPDRTAECFGFGGLVVDNPPPEGVEFVEIAVGEQVACGIAVDGSVHCWGDDQDLPPDGLKALLD